MLHGGARVGAGRKPKRAKSSAPVTPTGGDSDQPARTRFEGAHDFAVWAINAPDAEVTMDQKIRVMQTLAAIELKRLDASKPNKADQAKADTEASATGDWAPRKVRGFGVVNGGK